MSEHEKVKQFHALMGVPAKTRPEMPDDDARLLRCRLLLEEVMEFVGACGFDVVVGLGGGFSFVSNGEEPDLAAMAAENADVRYIAHGNDLAVGVDGGVFDAIHAANLRKAPGGVVVRRPDGKVVKPEGWQSADVARLLREWEP